MYVQNCVSVSILTLDRACRPTLNEPSLQLNLEISDYVNSKAGLAYREAAIAILKLISQRDPKISILALSLLDILTKNCSYPFHLQISRKEFLNELVKRFPERPPHFYSPVQRQILASIEEWYQTLCKGKYKDDFSYIRDMHRLLSSKGYTFPEIKLENMAVLNPSDNLKSLSDIQSEQQLVHSAKLQEFIRRGKPSDLQEANKLMKIMAGFKDDNVKQQQSQLLNDIDKLKRKVDIFNQMLLSGDKSDTLTDLYSSIKSSQPIITKIIEESSDEKQVNDLLALNDVVNTLIQKYQDEKGLKSESGSSSTPASDFNLIDFDDESAPISNNAEDQQGFDDLLSDLANLSFSNNNVASSNKSTNPLDLYGLGGSISLNNQGLNQGALNQSNIGGSFSIQQPTPQNNQNTTGTSFDLLSDLNSPSPQLQSNTFSSPALGNSSNFSSSNNSSPQLDPFGFNFPNSTPTQVQTPVGLKNLPITQNSDLKIEIGVESTSSNLFKGKILVSNLQSKSIEKFKFHIAVPKSCKLILNPQSNDTIYPFAKNGITQSLTVENPQSKPLKIKWKYEYNLNGSHIEDTNVSVLE